MSVEGVALQAQQGDVWEDGGPSVYPRPDIRVTRNGEVIQRGEVAA